MKGNEVMESITIHGRRIAYREAGAGDGREIILLVHGMAGSSTTWRKLMPKLATRYHVLAPDLPGHGRSSLDFDDYSLGSMASALRDLLIAKGVTRCTVIGQSLGGGVAMQFIYQYPEYCERICLIGSGGLGKDVNWTLRLLSMPGSEFLIAAIAPPFAKDIGNKLRAFLGSRGIRADSMDESWLAYETLSDPAYRRAFLKTLRAVVDGKGQAVSAHNRLHMCSQIPVQLIWGDRDHIIPSAHAQLTHEALPGSRLAVLPGARHYPHVEVPDAVEKVLVEFMTETEPGVIDLADVTKAESVPCEHPGRLAAEQKTAAAEQKAADRTATAEQKAADRTAAAEQKAADRTAAAEQKAADKTAAAERRTERKAAAADRRPDDTGGDADRADPPASIGVTDSTVGGVAEGR